MEARELAMSNHFLAIDRLEALIHPEVAESDRAAISLGDDGFSKKMTEGGGLDGVGGKKYVSPPFIRLPLEPTPDGTDGGTLRPSRTGKGGGLGGPYQCPLEVDGKLPLGQFMLMGTMHIDDVTMHVDDVSHSSRYTHHDLPPMLDLADAESTLEGLATSVEGLSQFSNLSFV